MSKQMIMRAALGVIGVLAAPALTAQTTDEIRPPGLRYVELALESVFVDLRSDRTGRVTQIVVKPCASCLSRSFPTSDSFKLLHGKEVMSANVWSHWDNRLGTVFYDAETGVATRVMYLREKGEDRL